VVDCYVCLIIFIVARFSTLYFFDQLITTIVPIVCDAW
jgi:hypothetical protein